MSLPQVTSLSRSALSNLWKFIPYFIVSTVILNIVLPEIGWFPFAVGVFLFVVWMSFGSDTIMMDREGFKYRSRGRERRYRWREIQGLTLQMPENAKSPKRVAFTVISQDSATQSDTSWGELGRTEILPIMNERSEQVFDLMRGYQALGLSNATSLERNERDFRPFDEDMASPPALAGPWGAPRPRARPAVTPEQIKVANQVRAALAGRKSQGSPERKANILSNRADRPVVLVREGGWPWFRPDRSKTRGY